MKENDEKHLEVSKSPLRTPQPVELSVVIPCYNEITHIEKVVRSWHSCLTDEKFSFELIVVNDGSMDGSGRVLDKLRTQLRELRVIHQLRGGRERAMRRGCEASRGRYILQLDGNGRYEPSDFLSMAPYMGEYGLIIAARTHRLDSWLRKAQSRFTALTAKTLFHCPLREPDVSFRLTQHQLLRTGLNQLSPTTECINLLLTIQIQHQYPDQVKEVLIPFRFRFQGKKRRPLFRTALKGVLQAFWELTAFRLRSFSLFTPRATKSLSTP